jgi:hypothetical protein
MKSVYSVPLRSTFLAVAVENCFFFFFFVIGQNRGLFDNESWRVN